MSHCTNVCFKHLWFVFSEKSATDILCDAWRRTVPKWSLHVGFATRCGEIKICQRLKNLNFVKQNVDIPTDLKIAYNWRLHTKLRTLRFVVSEKSVTIILPLTLREKKWLSRATGCRYPWNLKISEILWDTYRRLNTKFHNPMMNSCWEI